MKFFTTPNSKNIIATLYIVTIEKSEFTFLLYFHGPIQMYFCKVAFCQFFSDKVCEKTLNQDGKIF